MLARPSARLRAGQVLSLEGGEELELVSPYGDGRWTVARDGEPGVLGLLDTYGAMPLPPYIHEPLRDERDYQTVYADVIGSAAAPTAGLHFTTGLIEALRSGGVAVEGVTLHVGVDTFRPLTETRIEDHAIHSEWYHVGRDAADAIDEARASGRRVIAVGTTAVRVLETLYRDSAPGEGPTAPLDGATRVYITPGYTFRAVDALLTNFHLPRTSLLALVMAFGGVGFVRDCYEAAVAERYRFFSFGDAMFLAARGARLVNSGQEASGPDRSGVRVPESALPAFPFKLVATDGAARAGTSRDSTRSRGYSLLHARGHQGDGQGHLPASASGDRRWDRLGKHLSSGPATRERDGGPPGRPSLVHGLARPHPHGQRRLPGLQPQGDHPHRRGRGDLPLGLRRLAPRIHAGACHARATDAWRRHGHEFRRMPAGRRR